MQEHFVKDRRNFSREQADWVAEVYTEDTTYTAPVRNLSLGGAELMRPPLWKPEQNNLYKISFSDMVPSHTLYVHMQVCWITKTYVGLKFHELGSNEEVRLNKIISSISRTAVLEDGHFVM